MSEILFSPKKLDSRIVANFISERYGLDLIESPFSFDEGVENAAYKLVTEKDYWIAKIFADAEGLDQIEEEIRLYEYLNAHGVNAPKILRTKNGQSVELLRSDGCVFPTMVMKLEDLRRVYPNNITDEELQKIAAAMAKMHKVFQQYPEKEKIKHHNPLELREVEKSTFRYFLNSPNAKEFSEEELKGLDILDQKMEKVWVKVRKLQGLTESIIHGDLALGHAQFLPNGEPYFFDFSDYDFAPLSLELAITLSHLYREGDSNMNFDRYKHLRDVLLSEYQKIMPLTEKDLDSINLILIARMLAEIRYLNRISIQSGYSVDANGNKRRYQLAKNLLEP